MKLTKKFFYTICLFLFIAGSICAQTATTANYISHTIASGETLTALAKKYNTNVSTIMRLNHMNTQSVLKVGEVIKIPAPKTIAKDSTAIVAKVVTIDSTVSQGAQPVLHIVKSGESLYTLSKKYKTTIPQLKTWNKLTGNVIIDGHKLIVGYTTVASASAKTTTVAPAPRTDSSTLQTRPLVIPPAKDTVAAQPAQTPANTNVSENVAPSAPAPMPVAQVQQQPVDMSNIPAIGYFASSFGLGSEGHGLETSTGTSMTFKTSSGWSDKKYYILINNITPGSIVRVTSADNKVIYAKVLWGMSDMKENQGLDYRISTAAAAALGLSDAKFPLTVTFYE